MSDTAAAPVTAPSRSKILASISHPAGKSSEKLNSAPPSGRINTARSSSANSNSGNIAGKTSAQINSRPTGRAQPNSARSTSSSADAAGSAAPVIAGKTSQDLNTPRGGRSIAAGRNIVSQMTGIIKGTAPKPADDSFVHFHIKRRILPNSKDSVIVPINLPTPVKARSENGVPRSSSAAARSASVESAAAAATEKPFVIGGKTFDVPDKRGKVFVASPKRREQQPKKLLEKQSTMNELVVSSGAGSDGAAGAGAAGAKSHGPRAGKHIEKQSVPKQDVDDGTLRFTKPPFWDEQARPPPNCDLALPTRAFKAPTSRIAGGASRPADFMSPRARTARMKNESVIFDCFTASAQTSRRASSSGAQPQQEQPQTARAVRPHLMNHDGHNTKGFIDAIGRKRCSTPQPDKWQVYAPTLANATTNVFRIHPLFDHHGKSTFGTERKYRPNPALEFGGNFAHDSCRRADGPPAGRALQRSGSAPPPQTGNNNANNNNAAFRRSGSTASNTSLIDAPFDRSCNPTKFEPTFESRTTCRPWKEYTRPILNRAK